MPSIMSNIDISFGLVEVFRLCIKTLFYIRPSDLRNEKAKNKLSRVENDYMHKCK